MTKLKFAKEVSAKTGISLDVTQLMIKAFTTTIAEKLKDGERVNLGDFGTFIIKEVASTRVRSVNTGELVEVASRKRVRFKPTPEFTRWVTDNSTGI